MFFTIHTTLPSKQFGGVTVKTCQDLSRPVRTCQDTRSLGKSACHRRCSRSSASLWKMDNTKQLKLFCPPGQLWKRTGAKCTEQLHLVAIPRYSQVARFDASSIASIFHHLRRYKVLGGLGRFGHVFILSKGFWCCPLQTICVNDSAAKFGTAQQTRASSWRQRFVRSHPLCQELLWLWRHHRLSLPLHLGGSTFGHHNPSKNILVTCLQSSCERGLVLFDLLANPD